MTAFVHGFIWSILFTQIKYYYFSNMHDPLLRARKEAFKVLEDNIFDREYEVATRAIDLYIDQLEQQFGDKTRVMIKSTGQIVLILNNRKT